MEKLERKKLGVWGLIKAIIREPKLLVPLFNDDETPLTIKTFGTTIHILANPSHTEHVYTNQNPRYRRSPQAMEILEDAIGKKGLLSLHDREEWLKDKEALHGFFQPAKLKTIVSTMTETTANEFKRLKPYVETKTPLHVGQYFSEVTLHNLLDTLFGGIRLSTDYIPFREFFYLTSPLVFPTVLLFGKIPMPRYFRYAKVKKQIRAIGREIVKKSMLEASGENNLIKHLAKTYGYDTLEQCDQKMREHLCDEALTFLLAGHETIAALTVHVSVYMSLYPLVANKIYEEIQTVLGTRAPTYEDIQKLTYTTAVVKETLRLWPPSLNVLRSPVSEDILGGHSIKPTDMVMLPTYTTHRLSKYWDNPEGFDPNRFLKPLTREQTFLYMPFALGEQICLGMPFALLEVPILLAMLAQRYRLTLVPGTNLNPDTGVIHKMDWNIHMQVHETNEIRNS